MPELIGDWRETMMPAELGDAVLAKVVPTVRAQCGAVVLGGEPAATRDVAQSACDEWLAEHSSEPTRPLEQDIGAVTFSTRLRLEAAGHGRIGWLLLGPRPDGSALGKDEREALLAIADPLARGMHVASEREMRRAETENRIARLEAQIATRTDREPSRGPARSSLPGRLWASLFGRWA